MMHVGRLHFIYRANHLLLFCIIARSVGANSRAKTESRIFRIVEHALAVFNS